MSKYSFYINKYQEDLLKDLDTLVRIPSVSDETNPVDKKPFGQGVAHAFEAYEDIAKRLGFEVEQDDGYAISANYLDGRLGKHGKPMKERDAICIETQNMPDSIHNEKQPTVILKKGDTYDEVTSYQFKVR